MIIKLMVECPNCSEIICNEINAVGQEGVPEINVMYFEQTEWNCEGCERTFSIGEIPVDDIEDL